MRQISLTTLPRLSRNCKQNTKCLQFILFFRKKSVKTVSTVLEFLQEPLDMVSVRCGMMAGNRQWEHRFPVPFEELPRLHRREIVGPIFIAVDTKAGKGNPGNTGNRIRVFRRHQICAVIASQCSHWRGNDSVYSTNTSCSFHRLLSAANPESIGYLPLNIQASRKTATYAP